VVTPVCFAALVAKILGGFSFTALRYSTLIFSFVGSLALYDLLRQLSMRRSSSMLAGFALLANPVFVYLSYTFMSDVSYYAVMSISLTLYVRGIRRDSAGYLLAGSVFAAAAYLARQLGVALPMGVTAYLIIRDRRVPWRACLLVSLFPFIVFLAHSHWLFNIHGAPWAFSLNAVDKSFKVLLRPDVVLTLGQRLIDGLIYIGLFTLPLLLAQIVNIARSWREHLPLVRLFAVWLTGMTIYAVLNLWLMDRTMPYLSNVINVAGIGTGLLVGGRVRVTPDWVFWITTVLAPIAGAAQGALWTRRLFRVRSESHKSGTAVVLASLFMSGILALNSYLYDEYLIVLIPAAAYLVLDVAPIRRAGWVLGAVACVPMLGYSLREVGNHMAWNNARWEVANRLVADGVPHVRISGGLEWAGWYEFEEGLPWAIANGKGRQLFAWKQWHPKDFFIASQAPPDFEVVHRAAYRSLLVPGEGAVYALRIPR
jgi:hypothetical protein